MDELENGAAETAAEETAAPSIEETALAAFNAIEEREKGETPERGPDGKFIAKDASAPETATAPATETTDTPAGATGEPAAPAIDPPASLSAAAKAEWGKVPPAIQAEWAKREADVAKGFEQKAQELKRWESVEQVLAPRRQQLALDGMTEAQAIGQLFALSDFAAQDLPGFIRYLAQARGFDLATLVQPPQGQGQQPQLDPHLNAVLQKVNGIEEFLTSQQQATVLAEQQQAQSQIDLFRNEKSSTGQLLRPHFEAVRPMMAMLIDSGQAKDLQEAYDMAVYARPDIRTQILQEARAKEEADRKAADAKRLAEEKAKAEAAKRTAGTILRPNGALNGGRTPAKSMEETAREAYDRINGTA